MSVLTPTRSTVVGPRYKWVVLSNTTIGVLLATLNATSLIIALPVIFRGIHLNPLQAANFPYLLWIMMGYMLVSAAVVVTVGRIGDMFGRVKMYNLGFAWFTVGAILSVAGLEHGLERSPGARHPADVPGHRRGAPDGELGGHHHRRLPLRAARVRPRDEHGRRDRRLLPGHPRRWAALPGRAGAGCSSRTCRSGSSGRSGPT